MKPWSEQAVTVTLCFMASSDQTLIVSTFADGPYWPSVLEILGTPVGCSFYRPYNYRREWVNRDVDEALANGERQDVTAVVGMRFRRPTGPGGNLMQLAPEHYRFVPLRVADAQLKRDEATVDVHLRLKEYIPLNPGTKDFWEMQIEEANRFGAGGGPMLVWYATPGEATLVTQWRERLQSQPPGLMWEKLLESPLLSDEARHNFKDRTVAYAGEVRSQRSGEVIAPTEIQGGRRQIRMYGYSLSVDHRIEVDVNTRRIVERNRTDLPVGPDFEFITNPDLVQAAVPVVPFTGNYRQTPVSLYPKAVVGGRADLQWAPRFPGDEQRDTRGDTSLRIPFRTKRSWPWGLITLATLFMLAGVAMITLAVNQTSLPTFTRSALQAVGVTIISASVAFTTKALDDLRRQS